MKKSAKKLSTVEEKDASKNARILKWSNALIFQIMLVPSKNKTATY
jgi:hypothetical protein